MTRRSASEPGPPSWTSKSNSDPAPPKKAVPVMVSWSLTCWSTPETEL
jgi:hypothetical protein